MNRRRLIALALLVAALAAGCGRNAGVGGSRIDLVRFFALLVKAPGTFQIVTK